MSSTGEPLLGAIEAGGTKFVLAVGHSPTKIIARHEIPTRDPVTTLVQAGDWFVAQGVINSLGIGSFGPVDLNRSSPLWGHITHTPKPGWAKCDVAGYFADRLGVPIGFDTDVNAAALAEYQYGAGKGASSLAYVTVGTGIGGGLVLDGRAVHGAAHPELGHIFLRRHVEDHEFAGICPYHSDCLEGLASGPAIKARWGASLSELPTDHIAHEIIADYLAQLAHSLIAMTAVEIIVFGGGVMKTEGLLERVDQRAAELGAGYFPGGSKHKIVSPGLGQNAGLAGALMLAPLV
ncbi:ROK family protein [Erythrobacter sp. SCSIO 43205]|uniref:ROK family protein n=1 Tax=Erythrobacter sp. SCSIO 43205 TaxID=2779361 RepID=UPI001CA9F3E2|nr:ROK family protein [Erythrobacter sp. SCSIO 43205]UAB79018.1 ROK family protein [Erythrobacter sp. SCSIO 43205]